MTSKYIPPALRKAASEAASSESFTRPSERNERSFGQSERSYGQSPGYGGSAAPSPAPLTAPTNSRWKELNEPVVSERPVRSGDRGGFSSGGYGGGGGGGGGYPSSRGGYGSERERGGGGYGGGYGSGKNALGFHGDERPNARLEKEIFQTGEQVQSAGINFDKYDDIPVDVDTSLEPCTVFSEESIGALLMNNLVRINYVKPTPVQKYSIPIGLNGGDMMACAQTGSGKTAGFLFPVISMMLRNGALPDPDRGRGKATFPSALILAPTRELASQIFDEAQKFCYCTGIRPVVVYGGAQVQQQQRELGRGADILVATPGRLVDLIERGWINLECIRFLVLDEADRMLDMGFEPQIRRIVQEEGMPTSRQTFMFSATFPAEIQRLAADFMKDYTFLAVGRVGAASKDVSQRVVWVNQEEKPAFVLDFLSRVPEGLILIFVETKRGCDILEDFLYQKGFPTSSIHGDKSQREREEALRQFKTGKTPILVATDVAARGLDIPNVTQVINFDLPSQIDDYVHRIGRTGRVGNVGSALSLVNDKNKGIAKDLTELLIENEQECPEWLERFSGYGSRQPARRGGRGGRQFGARDYRREHSGRGGGGGGGSASFAPRSGGGWTGGPPSSTGGGRPQSDRNGGSGDNSAW